MARIYRTIPRLTRKQMDRFWKNVDYSPGQGPKGECWEWKGTRHKKAPYGKVKFNDITFIAHRVAFALIKGAPDPCHQICHSCDNPPCCNPSHLWEGTSTENMIDMSSKGRSMRGIPRNPESVSKGESHYCVKLTAKDVKKIRASALSDVALGAKYGVRPSTIWHIRKRKTWKHI